MSLSQLSAQPSAQDELVTVRRVQVRKFARPSTVPLARGEVSDPRRLLRIPLEAGGNIEPNHLIGDQCCGVAALIPLPFPQPALLRRKGRSISGLLPRASLVPTPILFMPMQRANPVPTTPCTYLNGKSARRDDLGFELSDRRGSHIPFDSHRPQTPGKIVKVGGGRKFMHNVPF